MSMYLKTGLLTLLTILIMSGCSRVGPGMMSRDRFDYTSAVADSWKEQLLMNIVRIRYLDWTAFVSIDQIITAYTMEHTGSARFTLRTPISQLYTNDQADVSWVGKFSERPTILYKPLSGKKYVRALLTPAQPVSILALMETGWPADQLGRIAIRSVNGFYNTNTEFDVVHHADPLFARFLFILKKIQSRDAMRVSIVEDAESRKTVTLVFNPKRLTPELRQEFQELKADLGLDITRNSFRVVRDSLQDSSDEIRIQGRSVLQILIAMAVAGVQIPEEHKESGIAPPIQPIPDEDLSGLPPLMTIKSGSVKPASSYVAVKYLDMWYWIDNRDHFAKRSLQYALTLITLLDSDEASGGSVVIPVN